MRTGILSTMVLVLLCAGCENGNFEWPKWGEDKSVTTETKPAAAAKKSLYERLGGKDAITAVVDDFVGRTAGDPKVNFTRKGIAGAEWNPTAENVAHLKVQLVDFLSMATGGPANYKGKSMKASHANMKITTAEFNALAADLSASLDKFKVPAAEKSELMAIAASTAKDIVTVP